MEKDKNRGWHQQEGNKFLQQGGKKISFLWWQRRALLHSRNEALLFYTWKDQVVGYGILNPDGHHQWNLTVMNKEVAISSA